jgi:MYXO-CTERM domain-containing protein
MKMPTHARALALGLSLVSLGAAHAALTPISSTPENDVLDSATGLAWIKAPTLSAGLNMGYRLATSEEALALQTFGRFKSDGIFALGMDSYSDYPNRISRGIYYGETSTIISIGHVAGPQGEDWLAGYDYEGEHRYTISQHYDPVLGRGVEESSIRQLDSYLRWVGPPESFRDVAESNSSYASNVIHNGWQTFDRDTPPTLACGAFNCHLNGVNTVWGPTLKGSGSPYQPYLGDPAIPLGYFMVKATGVVPEPSTSLTWALGLLALGALTLRRRD